MPLKIHSMVGLLPILPAVVLPRRAAELGAALGKHFARFLADAGMTDDASRTRGSVIDAPSGQSMILSLLPPRNLERVLKRGVVRGRVPLAARPARTLAPAPRRAVPDRGRGLSRVDRLRARRVDDRPVRRQLELARPGLVPGQLPVHRVAAPTGTRRSATSSRSSTRPGPGPACACGRWPPTCRAASSRSGSRTRTATARSPARSRSSATTPSGATCSLFHEYFHGDTGAGIGASHQTGWTGLVAHLLVRGGPLDRNAIPDGEPAP